MSADIIDLAPIMQQLEVSGQATQQHQCAVQGGLMVVIRLLPTQLGLNGRL